MADVYLGEVAEEQYAALERSTANFPLLDRIDELISRIADDPASTEFRRHRFQRPPAFRVPFEGPEGEPWCLLWQLEATAVVVLYIGPDSFDV